MRKRLAPLRKIKRLEIFYVTTIGVLMLMVVGTPFLVRRVIAMTNHLLNELESIASEIELLFFTFTAIHLHGVAREADQLIQPV